MKNLLYYVLYNFTRMSRMLECEKLTSKTDEKNMGFVKLYFFFQTKCHIIQKLASFCKNCFLFRNTKFTKNDF